MSFTRLLITAVVVENRPVAHVAAQYGVSQSWLFELVARYKAEGDAAFEPRTRRPRSARTAIPFETVDLILEYRQKLTATGLDAGPDTIAWHLEHHHSLTVSRATIARYLTKAGTPSAGDRDEGTHDRVRYDKVDKAGKITWRYHGQMYSIGIGRTHTGTRVIVLAQDLEIRVIDAVTGELLRELVLDTSKRYQGTGRPPGPRR